jgi:hypothetical protein
VFLIYYSPAFLRLAACSDIVAGLRMLAEIYRQARSLWPFEDGASAASQHVTVRIDQIKACPPERVMEGHLVGGAWLLVKRNEREAIVEHHPIYLLSSEADTTGGDYRILRFWSSDGQLEEDERDFITELEKLREERMDSSFEWLEEETVTPRREERQKSPEGERSLPSPSRGHSDTSRRRQLCTTGSGARGGRAGTAFLQSKSTLTV